jgi:DNA-binding NtrC family response regulator
MALSPRQSAHRGRGASDEADKMAGEKVILIVEDDRDTLDSWVQLLQDAGYRVAAAVSFEEGRRALDSSPDMLITDIRLGAYNGLQLVVRARLANPSLPVIVVTAFHDPVLQEETERLGAIYMRKPVDAAHVLAAIAKAFGPAQSQPSL